MRKNNFYIFVPSDVDLCPIDLTSNCLSELLVSPPSLKFLFDMQ